MKVILIGNPENRRVQMMQDALRSFGLKFQILAWVDFLSTPDIIHQIINDFDVIKIDSFGENFDVYKLLLEWGAEKIKTEDYHQIKRDDIQHLKNDLGKIQYSRQVFLGLQEALNCIEESAMQKKGVQFMNTPLSILQMFDKNASHELLETNQIPKTKFLGRIQSYDALLKLMKEKKAHQVFIKMAHGSSSSGVMAFRQIKDKIILKTSVELASNHALYNSLNIKTYQDKKTIKTIIDQLALENLIVEKWEPKASFKKKVFDLRLVVINHKVEHAVMRSSHSPMTNLHLGNERGNLEALIEHLGEAKWNEIKSTVIQAVNAYEGARIAGVDVMVQTNNHKVKIIEVNAFGDLVPRIVNAQGRSTYEEQAYIIKSIFNEVVA